jgi:DNA (cytosine-5)-methyltransferase 1
VFCERDEFCRQVLAKHWPDVPVVADIFEFDGGAYRGADLLTAGIPCQPYSCAGKQLGDADDRALWPEARRVIAEVRPRWVVVENVAGFIGMALDGVLADLEAEGYECGTVVLPACAVNAPHRRDRVWIVAHSDECGRNPQSLLGSLRSGGKDYADAFQSGQVASNVAHPKGKRMRTESTLAGKRVCPIGGGETLAHTGSARLEERQEQPAWHECPTAERGGYAGGERRQPESELGRMAARLPAWLDGHFDAEPDIPRVATGIPDRTSRLKALGNAIVPQVAYQIFRAIGAAT